MELKDDANPTVLIKELAKLIRQSTPQDEKQHYMMNILTGLGAHIVVLQGRIDDLEDSLQEWTNTHRMQ